MKTGNIDTTVAAPLPRKGGRGASGDGKTGGFADLLEMAGARKPAKDAARSTATQSNRKEEPEHAEAKATDALPPRLWTRSDAAHAGTRPPAVVADAPQTPISPERPGTRSADPMQHRTDATSAAQPSAETAPHAADSPRAVDAPASGRSSSPDGPDGPGLDRATPVRPSSPEAQAVPTQVAPPPAPAGDATHTLVAPHVDATLARVPVEAPTPLASSGPERDRGREGADRAGPSGASPSKAALEPPVGASVTDPAGDRSSAAIDANGSGDANLENTRRASVETAPGGDRPSTARTDTVTPQVAMAPPPSVESPVHASSAVDADMSGKPGMTGESTEPVDFERRAGNDADGPTVAETVDPTRPADAIREPQTPAQRQATDAFVSPIGQEPPSAPTLPNDASHHTAPMADRPVKEPIEASSPSTLPRPANGGIKLARESAPANVQPHPKAAVDERPSPSEAIAVVRERESFDRPALDLTGDATIAVVAKGSDTPALEPATSSAETGTPEPSSALPAAPDAQGAAAAPDTSPLDVADTGRPAAGSTLNAYAEAASAAPLGDTPPAPGPRDPETDAARIPVPTTARVSALSPVIAETPAMWAPGEAVDGPKTARARDPSLATRTQSGDEASTHATDLAPRTPTTGGPSMSGRLPEALQQPAKPAEDLRAGADAYPATGIAQYASNDPLRVANSGFSTSAKPTPLAAGEPAAASGPEIDPDVRSTANVAMPTASPAIDLQPASPVINPAPQPLAAGVGADPASPPATTPPPPVTPVGEAKPATPAGAASAPTAEGALVSKAPLGRSTGGEAPPTMRDRIPSAAESRIEEVSSPPEKAGASLGSDESDRSSPPLPVPAPSAAAASPLRQHVPPSDAPPASRTAPVQAAPGSPVALDGAIAATDIPLGTIGDEPDTAARPVDSPPAPAGANRILADITAVRTDPNRIDVAAEPPPPPPSIPAVRQPQAPSDVARIDVAAEPSPPPLSTPAARQPQAPSDVARRMPALATEIAIAATRYRYADDRDDDGPPILNATRMLAGRLGLASPSMRVAEPPRFIDPPQQPTTPASAVGDVRSAAGLSEGPDVSTPVDEDRRRDQPTAAEAPASRGAEITRETLLPRPSAPVPPASPAATIASALALDSTWAPQSVAHSSQLLGNRPSTTPHTLSIQLNPLHLGVVDATIRLSATQLEIEVKVENREAFERLKGEEHVIEKALRAQGFEAPQVTVIQSSVASQTSARPDGAPAGTMPQPTGGGASDPDSSAGGHHPRGQQEDSHAGNRPAPQAPATHRGGSAGGGSSLYI